MRVRNPQVLNRIFAAFFIFCVAPLLASCDLLDDLTDIRPDLQVTVLAEDGIVSVGDRMTYRVDVRPFCSRVGCDVSGSDAAYAVTSVQDGEGRDLEKTDVGYRKTFERPGEHIVTAIACYVDGPQRCFFGSVTVWAIEDDQAIDPDCDIKTDVFSLKCVAPAESFTGTYRLKLYFNFFKPVEVVHVGLNADGTVFDLFEVNTEIRKNRVSPGPLPLSFALPVRAGGATTIDLFIQVGAYRDTLSFDVEVR